MEGVSSRQIRSLCVIAFQDAVQGALTTSRSKRCRGWAVQLAAIELTRLGRASLMRGSRLPRLAVRPADSDRIRGRNSLLRRLSVPTDSDNALTALDGCDDVESGRAAGRRGSKQGRTEAVYFTFLH